jgi:hypothetical protein
MSSEVSVPPVLSLADGMVGMPDTKSLEVVPIAGGDFVELIDRDEPALGWLAAAADDVRPGMTASLRAGGRVEADEILLVLLASHGEPAVVTANLAGPIAVAPDGSARQLVLEDPGYEVRARLSRLAPASPHGD